MSLQERHVMFTLSCLLLLVASTLSFPAHTDTRTINDISKFYTYDDYSSNGGFQQLYEDYAPVINKRTPQLSINQDLMSIASMLRNEAGRRKMEAAQNFLIRIGKRSSPSRSELSENEQYSALRRGSLARQAKRGRLSINMPLDALTDMIHTQRRQQYGGRVKQLNRKLSRLG